MGHKCFISFKMEDEQYKKAIQNGLDIDMIDKSLTEPIDSEDEDYIMKKIRDEYLSESIVTIHLIGAKSSENEGWDEQRFVKRELQASLYNGNENTRSGILGVVLPSMKNSIYSGSRICHICGESHSHININDSTAIKEFSYNYYIPHDKCAWSEDDRYCVLVYWDDFYDNPEKFIDQAFEKRSHPIADKVRVYPK